MSARYAIIIFVDKNGADHKIVYELYDTSLAKRWSTLIRENQRDPKYHIHTTLYNLVPRDIPVIHNEIIEVCKQINTEYDEPLPVHDYNSTLDETQLNYLHSLFERFGDRAPENIIKGTHTDFLNNNFLRLNELIHMYELALGNGQREFPSMHAIADYYPQLLFRHLEPVDYLSVYNWYDWGQLYLGYNTLGKEWLTVAMNNDIEVVERDAVRPQERFAAEIWLSFYERNSTPLDTSMMFEKWYNKLSPELKAKVPLDNMTKMVMGKFLIGRVVIDEYFLSFEPDINCWMLPNSETKQKWNSEVFSTFTSIKQIIIV